MFWDRHLEPGGIWPDALQREVAKACCVVLAWSESSILSDWVRKEAENGNQRNRLVPVRLARVTPPAGFEHVHAANLIGWNGSAAAVEFQPVVAAIREMCGGPDVDTTMEPQLLLVSACRHHAQRGDRFQSLRQEFCKSLS